MNPMDLAMRLLKEEVPHDITEDALSWNYEDSNHIPYYESTQSPEWSKGLCEDIACAVNEHLTNLGHNAEQIDAYHKETGAPHTVSRVGDQVIDYARRQFDENAEVPVIESLSDFEKNFSYKPITKNEPMDIAMRLLKRDWERDYFFQTARDSGIPEHEIEEAWLNSQNFTPPIPPGNPNNLHPGDEGELEAATEGSRVYFPTTKVSREASPGIRRVVRHDDPSVGTFRDTPFNEATNFTKGKPMEIAMRLLKMPLIPESVRHTGTEEDIDDYEADFEHPETGEIYPMRGYVHSDEAGTFIYPPDKKFTPTSLAIDAENSGEIAEATFSPQSDYASDAKEWTGSPYIRERDPFGEGNEFGEEAPPLGMGTAMYDLAAIMADKHGAKIVPSVNRSTPALNMWAKHEDKGHWPRRTPEGDLKIDALDKL